MHWFQLLDSSQDYGTPLVGSYDPALVFVSILIAGLAAYAGLGFAGRVSAAETARAKRAWLLGGAAAMGVGVWAMHFIGMLAFRLPVPVAYDVRVTLLSLTPAFLASLVVLRFLTLKHADRGQVLLSGTLMGLGIGTMHYTGMAAMWMAAEMFYDGPLVALSIAVAVGLASAALAMSRLVGQGADRVVGPSREFAAAGVMGLAVAGMHYTGMAAVRFFDAPGMAVPEGALDPLILAILVGLASAFILVLAVFAAIVDRRLQAAAVSARVSRARMLQAIESISEGFALYDKDDRLVLCNAHYRELLRADGYDLSTQQSFESIIRSACERGLIPDAEGRVDAWVAERLRRHLDPVGPHVQKRRGDCWVKINEYRTEDGGTVAIYNDITELKRAEKELSDALENLQDTQAHLVESEKMAALGKLTAGIAHEINNPVGVVTSSADNSARCVQRILDSLDRGHTLDEVRSDRGFQQSVQLVRENAKVVVEAGQRIATIMRSLKAFARPDDNDFQQASVEEGLESTLALLQHQMREGIALVKRFGNVPRVYCMPAAINQVFMTILTNAIQSIEGNGEIRVETSQDPTSIYVNISDTGRGMESHQVKGLFDSSFTTKGSRIGVGLGLFNAYRVIRQHRGEISVKSELGEGTGFSIRFPIEQAQPAET